MQINQLDLKSIRSYGIHGALGLLMGIGVGFIFFLILSSLIAGSSMIMIGAAGLVTALVIYGLYGFYIGYIFGGQKSSYRISITCAIAGVFGGLVTAGLLTKGFITMSAGYFDPLFFSLFFTGPVLGFPKIKNMVIMTASSAFGALIGYGVYSVGQDMTVYLNSSGGTVFALLIAIIFSLLAIGIAGASIAVGMYFSEMEMYGNPGISGNATTEIIDTDHGKALKISVSGSTSVNMKQTGGTLAADPNGRPVYAWVYSEKDGTLFSLSIKRDNGWGREIRIGTEREMKLNRGWQNVSLSVGSLMYD